MPSRRIFEPRQPVQVFFEGKPLVADASTSLASSLIGAGQLLLARSPKFHRPRGPYCLRGGCDGCLVRINGTPNVMSCLHMPQEGDVVERQNFTLSPDLDLLRMNDWFFRDGMNHHEFLAGVPGLQRVMQNFARRISGLGELPTPSSEQTYAIERREVDVLILGAGVAGLCVANELAKLNIVPLVIEKQKDLGGAFNAFPKHSIQDLSHWDELFQQTQACFESSKSELVCNSKALGVYEEGDWIVEQQGKILLRIRPKVCVLATGAHDFVLDFENNDLPGVVSARAASQLLRDGVLVGERPLVVGEGMYADVFSEAAKIHHAKVLRSSASALVSAHGLSHVKSVTLMRDDKTLQRVNCDAIVIDGPKAPAFELAGQLGTTLKHVHTTQSIGYAIAVNEYFRTDAKICGVYAIGEVTGEPFHPIRFAQQAIQVAQAIQQELNR